MWVKNAAVDKGADQGALFHRLSELLQAIAGSRSLRTSQPFADSRRLRIPAEGRPQNSRRQCCSNSSFCVLGKTLNCLVQKTRSVVSECDADDPLSTVNKERHA